MTPKGKVKWEDLDPTVFTATGGTVCLCWSNTNCYIAKLKPNMVELDGSIESIDLPNYTEVSWLHKHGSLYYLSHATGFPEKIACATADKITGPWIYRGILVEGAANSNTIHQAIIEFKGQGHFICHTGMVQRPSTGGSFHRSVCVDYLRYNPDGTMKRVEQTTEGADLPPLKP